MNSAEQYARMMAEMQRDVSGGVRNGDRPRFFSIAQFVSRYGRVFEWRPKPPEIRQGVVKMCFENAYQLARKDRSLTYVEGYATRIIPTHHAWVVTPDGIVIDNTWAEGQYDDGRAYFGVPFGIEYVRRRRKEQRATGGISVMDDWQNHHPTLRTEFVYEQAGVNPWRM